MLLAVGFPLEYHGIHSRKRQFSGIHSRRRPQWEGCQDEHKDGVIWLHEYVRIGSNLSQHNEIGEGM